MGTLILQEGEAVKLKITAQLASGYPQTAGDLFLTDRRLILVPNQLLSLGSGRPWEIKLSEIQNLQVKNLLQGGPFVGRLGNRLEITALDNSKHLLSSLSDISPLVNALSQQLPGKVITEASVPPTPAPQPQPASTAPVQSTPPVPEAVAPQPTPPVQEAVASQPTPPVQEAVSPQPTPPAASSSQGYPPPPPPPQAGAQPGTTYSARPAESFFDKIKFKSAPSNVVCQNPSCRSYNTVNVRKDTLNWGIWLLVVGFPVGLIFFVVPGALAMVAGMFTIGYSFFIPSNNWKCKTCKYHWKS